MLIWGKNDTTENLALLNGIDNPNVDANFKNKKHEAIEVYEFLRNTYCNPNNNIGNQKNGEINVKEEENLKAGHSKGELGQSNGVTQGSKEKEGCPAFKIFGLCLLVVLVVFVSVWFVVRCFIKKRPLTL